MTMRSVLAFAALAVVLALSSCATQVAYVRTPRACQDQAMEIVWRKVLQRTDRAPDVWWVPRAAQNCGNPKPDGARGFLSFDGQTCQAGSSWRDGMQIVWFGSWANTGGILAHEAIHVALWRDAGDGDPGHLSPLFRSGGPESVGGAMIREANLCAPAVNPSAMVYRSRLPSSGTSPLRACAASSSFAVSLR